MSTPTRYMFMSMVMGSTILAISSPNIMSFWIAMEINMFSMVLLLSTTDDKSGTNTSSLYLAVQATGSMMILASTATMMTSFSQYSELALQLGLLLKLGAPPAFCWYPNLISQTSWMNAWLLMTVQKMGPLMALSVSTLPHPVTISLCGMMALVGGAGGMVQTQMRPLLAYSSMTQMSWVIMTTMVSTPTAIMFFLAYSLVLSPIIIIMLMANHRTANTISSSSKKMKLTVSILLLSLAGLPPLLGFLPKVQSMLSLAASTSVMIIMLLIIGSLMNLFFYLNLMMSSMIPKTKLPSHTITKEMSMPSLIALSCMGMLIFLLPIWL